MAQDEGPIGLGWRIHSWEAVVVALRGPTTAPVVLERQRVVLMVDQGLQEPYHAAVPRPLDEAQQLIHSVREQATAAAEAFVRGYVGAMGAVSAVGVVGGDRTVPRELSRILTKHALLHASERDLYERAVVAGATRAGLPVTTIPAKGKGGTVDHASEVLGVNLSPVLTALGKTIGSPWQQVQKDAAAAALVALRSP